MSDPLPARSLVFIRACAVMFRDNHPAYLVLILSMPHKLQSRLCEVLPRTWKLEERQNPAATVEVPEERGVEYL